MLHINRGETCMHVSVQRYGKHRTVPEARRHSQSDTGSRQSCYSRTRAVEEDACKIALLTHACMHADSVHDGLADVAEY